MPFEQRGEGDLLEMHPGLMQWRNLPRNPSFPAHQLLSRYRGKACLCGQEWQDVPEASSTSHRACFCCFRGGLGEPLGLSWVHAWGAVGVTMLREEAGFWHITFYVEASGGYDMRGTEQTEFLVLPWLLYYVTEAEWPHIIIIIIVIKEYCAFNLYSSFLSIVWYK